MRLMEIQRCIVPVQTPCSSCCTSVDWFLDVKKRLKQCNDYCHNGATCYYEDGQALTALAPRFPQYVVRNVES
ncbi:hypothetical protein AVEN_76129-1 [Araneus ventricosus]|uniref:Uncharacterized protein n=1 Tax=Araneus ventricosus TaxID=182803 RepID=A0A4Y2IIC7_ARAVE|nr:hypothetical protein AVEN_76129-1 [Araneus ventricosus]